MKRMLAAIVAFALLAPAPAYAGNGSGGDVGEWLPIHRGMTIGECDHYVGPVSWHWMPCWHI